MKEKKKIDPDYIDSRGMTNSDKKKIEELISARNKKQKKSAGTRGKRAA